MAIEVHVQGRVVTGKLPYFADAVERYKEYAAANGYAVPRVLLGLSGEMNTIRLVYRYDDPAEYQKHETRTMRDGEYGRIAGEMSLVDGTVRYEIYEQV
jgi:hypothetical protein